MLGTLLAAHVAKEAWISRPWAAVIGFTAIAAAGTGLICYNSLGRQAEGVLVATADHDKTVGEKTTIEKDLADAKADLKKYREAADTECKSGEGPKCRSTRASRDFYDTSVKGFEARLKQLTPPKVVDPSAERFGDYAAALGYDKEKAKTLAMLIVPYFVTLLFEFGTVISFGYGFAPKRQPAKVEALEAARGTLGAHGPRQRHRRGPLDGPDHHRRQAGQSAPPVGGGMSKQDVLYYVLAELDKGRTVPSQQALVGLSGQQAPRLHGWGLLRRSRSGHQFANARDLEPHRSRDRRGDGFDPPAPDRPRAIGCCPVSVTLRHRRQVDAEIGRHLGERSGIGGVAGHCGVDVDQRRADLG